MDASIGFFLFCLVGSSVGYYVQRHAGYDYVPNEFNSAEGGSNVIPEYSQRLFWGNQGSNQVGGTGLWATLTNKFPFLGTMFGRMELPTQYGAPNQLLVPALPGAPEQIQRQVYEARQLAPAARDVGLTDDAVIVTPPHVPVAPPRPQPAPEPVPAAEPAQGYHYQKPQYRLELPQKY